jgi:putative ABC transport system permease protein
MDAFLKDLKQSLRMFAKRPAFTLAAVAALTLGIGVNTAVFSVVNAVLLRPVAFPDPDRLVIFMNTSPQGSGTAASPAKFQHYRSQTNVVQDVAAYNVGVVNYTGGSSPEQLKSGRVSADFFRLFGAPMRLGRPFAPQEDLPGGDKVVVLDRAFWATRFDSDPTIVGKTISLSGEAYTVVGVLAEFHFEDFGATPQVWLPFQLDPNTTDQGHYFQVAGRLKPGVTLGQAKAQLQLSADAYRRKFPNALGPKNAFTVEPVATVLVRNVRSSLIVLATAVSLVLLIACANVANLLLARATERRREMAIRAAIGGSRARIVRQLLSESVALSLVGGALGLVFGVMGIRALLAVNTAGLPRVGQDGSSVGLDWRVAGFTLVVSVLTGLLFGLIPAIASARADLTSVLKESAGRSGTGGRQNRTRSVLVIAEVALAMVLLIGSALLIRTAVALGHVDPGFDASHVLTMRMSLTGARFLTAAGVEQSVHAGVERLRAIPGVTGASATCCVPLEGGYGLPFVIVGRPLPEGQPFHGGGSWTTLSPGYFDVFRIPVKRGRAFDDRDTTGATSVVVINEAMARQFWKTGDPLNDRLVIGRGVMREFAAEPERQIIGIVGDTRDGGLNSDPQPTMYVPQAQVPDAANALNVRLTPMAWVVRTQGDPHAFSLQIQEQLRQATGLPVTDVRSMDEVVSLSTSRERFNMWLMTVFGVSALALAAIGIYGLMAYSVEQRTQEIGIRLALGAGVSQVRRMVIFQGTRLALAGVVLGVAAAWALVHFIASITALLFGVGASDPVVFAGVPVLLMLVSLASAWLPALRASRVDPIVAMRAE